MHHLIDANHLSQSHIMGLFEKTSHYLLQSSLREKPLLDQTVALLFFENSTRTLASFELAAKRLGGTTLVLDIQKSSTAKGESIADTIANLVAMGCNAMVIRHQESGIFNMLATQFGTKTHFVNAGDGQNQHPTQGLLDAFTLHQQGVDFKTLSIAIVGDVLHSRVARSQIAVLRTLGTTDIRLVGPETLVPEHLAALGGRVFHDLRSALDGVDVVSVLRLQKERMAQGLITSLEGYTDAFGITDSSMQYAKPNAVVLHPGPMNRELEIASSVADGAQSLILKQVTNGVAMRMAVLERLFSTRHGEPRRGVAISI